MLGSCIFTSLIIRWKNWVEKSIDPTQVGSRVLLGLS